MSDIVIKAEKIGKKYTIGHQAERGGYTALRDVLMQNAQTLWNKTKDLATGKPIIQGDTMEEVWALKDVSFEIRRGEVVGIIGRNGAGKSTLLKILSRITEPSTGRVSIKGRVASLLEVGTGFHPELSGRENIYLNGTILGMTRAEIKQKFDEIVSFAEVEKYLDTPVKRYSSGMYVRLAFAVAAHLEPEILIIDEVLAVGDAQFQKKCLGKMEEVGSEGRTVIFVSHNMAAVNNLCKYAMLLNSGILDYFSTTRTVVEKYILQGAGAFNQTLVLNHQDEVLDVVDFFVCDIHGNRINVFKTSENTYIKIRINLKKSIEGLRIGFDIYNISDGEILFRTFDDDLNTRERGTGVIDFTCKLPSNLLISGIYAAKLQIGIHNIRWIVNGNLSINFEIQFVDGINSKYADSRPGKIMPLVNWETSSIH
jgi:lipopolysaccharide transport system ATP-binding protein